MGMIRMDSIQITDKIHMDQLRSLDIINTDAREAEVRSRNLNCRVYASRIDEQKRALELEKAGATKISNTTTVQQPIKWKNESIICNTVGTQTYCN